MRKNIPLICAILLLVAQVVVFGIMTARTDDVSVSMTSTPSLSTTTTSTTTTTTTTLSPTTTTSAPTTTAYRPVVTAVPADDVWDRLCNCECGGHCNWSINAYHDGGLQFHPKMWTAYVAAGKSYALVGYPEYAYQATREQQITVAIRMRDGVPGSSDPYLNPQGYGAWPTCRRVVGV